MTTSGEKKPIKLGEKNEQKSRMKPAKKEQHTKTTKDNIEIYTVAYHRTCSTNIHYTRPYTQEREEGRERKVGGGEKKKERRSRERWCVCVWRVHVRRVTSNVHDFKMQFAYSFWFILCFYYYLLFVAVLFYSFVCSASCLSLALLYLSCHLFYFSQKDAKLGCAYIGFIGLYGESIHCMFRFVFAQFIGLG